MNAASRRHDRPAMNGQAPASYRCFYARNRPVFDCDALDVSSGNQDGASFAGIHQVGLQGSLLGSKSATETAMTAILAAPGVAWQGEPLVAQCFTAIHETLILGIGNALGRVD